MPAETESINYAGVPIGRTRARNYLQEVGCGLDDAIFSETPVFFSEGAVLSLSHQFYFFRGATSGEMANLYIPCSLCENSNVPIDARHCDCSRVVCSSCATVCSACARQTCDSCNHAGFCPRCVRRNRLDLKSYTLKPYVAEYDQKADWSFHKKDYERTKAYLGIELEVEMGGGTLEGLFRISKKYLPDKHMWVYDGSLNNGAELVITPHTLDKFREVNLRQMLFQLRGICCSYKNGRCGLHVHVGLEGFKKKAVLVEKLRRMMCNNKSWFKRFSQRNSQSMDRWCFIPKSYDVCDWNAKYVCLNMSEHNTLEFRIFRGTLGYQRFMASLQLVDALMLFAQSHSMALFKTGGEMLEFYRFLKNRKRYSLLFKYCSNKGYWKGLSSYSNRPEATFDIEALGLRFQGGAQAAAEVLRNCWPTTWSEPNISRSWHKLEDDMSDVDDDRGTLNKVKVFRKEWKEQLNAVRLQNEEVNHMFRTARGLLADMYHGVHSVDKLSNFMTEHRLPMPANHPDDMNPLRDEMIALNHTLNNNIGGEPQEGLPDWPPPWVEEQEDHESHLDDLAFL